MAKTMDDAFVPDCKPDGDYAAVQCFEHEGFAKQCWCVTKDGQEIKGTRTSDGQIPDCTAAAVNEEAKKLEKQQDKQTNQTEALQRKPAKNETTFEVEVQVMLNDTEIGTLQDAIVPPLLTMFCDIANMHSPTRIHIHIIGKNVNQSIKSLLGF